MKIRDLKLTYPRLLLAGLLIILVTASIVGLSTSSAAFGSYNAGWEGTRDMRALATEMGVETTVTQSSSGYNVSNAAGATAFILSPTERYSDRDVTRIRGFLEEGGTMVVASDFNPEANTLLTRLNVTARFDGRPIRDEQQYYRSPAFPVATNLAASPVMANVSRLTLNHGTVVMPGENSTVLANTSGFAYIDANGNEELDDTESLEERPVVVRERYDEGAVVLVSDPSLFLNAMLDAPDNEQFVRNLVAGEEIVVFDYSHRAGVPPAVSLLLTISKSPFLQFLVVSGLVGVTAVVWRGGSVSKLAWWVDSEEDTARLGFSQTAVIERVTARHPEWDQQRVEDVARSIMTGASSEDEDD